MLKRMVATTAMAVAFLVGGMVAHADEGSSELKLDGIKCLFCKMQVKEDVAVDYKGAKIYLGCEGCVGAFKNDVKKVAAKANAQLVATKQAVQEKCPMSGQPLNDEMTLVVAKAKVGFCCGNCKAAAEGLTGDAQVEKLFGDKVFDKAFKVVKK